MIEMNQPELITEPAHGFEQCCNPRGHTAGTMLDDDLATTRVRWAGRDWMGHAHCGRMACTAHVRRVARDDQLANFGNPDGAAR
jgi:hypothetical protein